MTCRSGPCQSTRPYYTQSKKSSILAIEQPELFAKTALVVEDEITDGAFYAFLFSNLRDVIGVPSVSCEWLHGGGERTLDVARNRVRDGRIVTVIVDTDAHSPACPRPEKLRSLELLASQERWPLIFVHPTPCKETENLIPLDVVEMLEGAADRANELQFLRNIQDGERAERAEPRTAYWLYFDIKNGVDHLYVAGLHAAAKEWTASKISYARLTSEEFDFGGFGNHVVPQVMRQNALSARLRDCVRRRDWLHVFGEFIAEVMWPCVCGVRQFT